MHEKVRNRKMKIVIHATKLDDAKQLFKMVASDLFLNLEGISFLRKDDGAIIEFEVQADGKYEILRDITLKANECDIYKFEMKSDSSNMDFVTEVIDISGNTEDSSNCFETRNENVSEHIKSETHNEKNAAVEKEKSKLKDNCVIPEDLASLVKGITTIEELVDIVMKYCNYPADLKDELIFIFNRAKDINENGDRIVWDVLLDDHVTNPLLYKKKLVTPMKNKIGGGLRFPVFVREMLNFLPGISEDVTNKFSFNQVVEENLYIDNFGILGPKGRSFFKVLQDVHTNEYELSKKVEMLFSNIYESVIGSDLITETQCVYSIQFVTFVLSQNEILPTGVNGEEFKNFNIGDYQGEEHSKEIMRIFIKTGVAVSRFLQKCFNTDMNLKEFLTLIKPVLVKEKEA